jgi:uncharacterized cupredoxin-like copper-binding protein
VPLALSTGHQVGLAVTAAAFIVFALASSFLFPRFRPQYPGGGLSAFIVIAFVFFFGMLTAVEVFGAESAEGGGEATAAEPGTTVQRTTTQTQTATGAQTTTAPRTTTQVEIVQNVEVSETEFKITLASTSMSAGTYTFVVKNDGKLPHDFAIKGGAKTKLIPPGGSAQLQILLKPGKYHFYCSVPGHEQAGMKVDATVS